MPRGRIDRLLVTSDEEGPRVDGRCRGAMAAAARRAAGLLHRRRADLGRAPRRHDQEQPARQPLRRLTVRGVQGHIAYPTSRATRSTSGTGAGRTGRHRWDAGQRVLSADRLPDLQPHAGTGAGNVIPGRTGGGLHFRFSTESTPQSLRQRVRGRPRPAPARPRLAWTLGGEPFLTPVGRWPTR